MSYAEKDFSKRVIRALAQKGITIIGTTTIPDPTSDMPFANGSRGYQLNDNGTHRIKTLLEVMAMADAPEATTQRIEHFYDRSLRLWTCLWRDEEGNQLGAAQYAVNKTERDQVMARMRSSEPIDYQV